MQFGVLLLRGFGNQTRIELSAPFPRFDFDEAALKSARKFCTSALLSIRQHPEGVEVK
jgi:hypothetical protein